MQEIENTESRSLYEPPSFDEMGSYREETGWLVVGWADSQNPGFF